MKITSTMRVVSTDSSSDGRYERTDGPSVHPAPGVAEPGADGRRCCNALQDN